MANPRPTDPTAPQSGFSRREFLRQGSLAAFALASARPLLRAQAPSGAVPAYLRGDPKEYGANPRKAAEQWFGEAKFGLFMHYGVFSLLEKDAWVQLDDKIPVREYEKLKDRFTAEKFDADRITDLALAAGMRYVNLTTRHHDGFCLFDSKQTDFTSTRSPAKRDLVGELAGQCDRKGLGLCLYYSHGRDWRHPHAPNNDEWGGSARPKYDPPDPTYATGAAHDLQKYVAFMKDQVTELLTQYGPVAAIWLDGIAVPKSRPARIGEFHAQELYDHIHRLQPQVLVSYKQGLLGTEDFMAPERTSGRANRQKSWRFPTPFSPKAGAMCEPTTESTSPPTTSRRRCLDHAATLPANLLLNTEVCCLTDRSIRPTSRHLLREAYRRLKRRRQARPA